MGGGDRRRRHYYYFHGHRIEAASFLISYLISMCIWNSANCHSRAVSEMLNQPVTYGRCHLRRSPTMSGTGPKLMHIRRNKGWSRNRYRTGLGGARRIEEYGQEGDGGCGYVCGCVCVCGWCSHTSSRSLQPQEGKRLRSTSTR